MLTKNKFPGGNFLNLHTVYKLRVFVGIWTFNMFNIMKNHKKGLTEVGITLIYDSKNLFHFLLILSHNQVTSYWASRHTVLN